MADRRELPASPRGPRPSGAAPKRRRADKAGASHAVAAGPAAQGVVVRGCKFNQTQACPLPCSRDCCAALALVAYGWACSSCPPLHSEMPAAHNRMGGNIADN